MRTVLFLSFFALSYCLRAQVSVVPRLASTDDTVTVYYNALAGNGGLAGFTGNVYAHTGVITQNSTHPGDWKYTKAGWGSTDSSVLMTPLGNDQYSIRFHIRSYYGIPITDTVLQLAFIFRNSNGSISGRSGSNGDIFYAINIEAPSLYLGYTQSADGIRLWTDKGHFRVFAPEPNVLGLVFESDTVESYSSEIVVDSTFSNLSFSQTPTHLRINSGSLEFFFEKSSLLMGYRKGQDTVYKEGYIFTGGGQKGVSFKWRANQAVYGMGSRAIAQNRTGRVLESYNRASFGYSAPNDQLNITFPAFVSEDGWGAFFDNYDRSWTDFGSTAADQFEFRSKGGDLAFYIYSGDDNDAILKKYSQLTGFPYLPPRWAFGYIQSKYGYQNDAEVRTMVNTMAAQDFPLDGVILDLYWFGDPSTMGNLDWDVTRFNPNLGLINWLHARDIRMVLIYETYFTQNSTNFSTLDNLGYFGKNSNGSTYVLNGFWAGNSGLLDLFHPQAWNWMWPYYHSKLVEGVDGFWNDLGEPESHPTDMIHYGNRKAESVHNLYSNKWAEGLYNSYESQWPNKRVFNLIRSGFAGMQRFGAIPWSGDIQRSFNGLQAQIPTMLGMSMSGVPYMHSDLGGFTGGGQDNELYTKWIALGTFSPIMRAHGQQAVPTEPYAYPEPFKSQLRNLLKMRHTWFPYNYTIAEENAETGRPIALPMEYFYPSQSNLKNLSDQYMWGKDVLVAPYLTQGSNSRSIILPAGEWIDFWAGTVINGGGSVTKSGTPDQIPLFLRAGSLIPLMGREESTLEAYQYDHIRWMHPYKSSGRASAKVFADDGLTPDTRSRSEYEEYTLLCDQGQNYARYRFDLAGPGFPGSADTVEVETYVLRFTGTPTSIRLNGVSIPITNNLAAYNSSTTAAYYQASNQQIRFKFPWLKTQTIVEINDAPFNPFEDSSYACYGSPYPLDAGLGYSEYLWNNGQTSSSIQVTSPGDYWVRIKDIDGLFYYDSTRVFVMDAGLPDTLLICKGGSVYLEADTSLSYSYLWSSGETTSSLRFSALADAQLALRLRIAGVDCWDSVYIQTYQPISGVNLGPDSIRTCTLDAGAGFTSYLWNTGETTRRIEVLQAGYYSVEVSDALDGCISRDTVYAVPGCLNFWSGRSGDDFLGSSTAISSNYAIAGAPGRDGSYLESYDSVSLNWFVDMGAVYIYERISSSTWESKQELMAVDRHEGDGFGWAVGIDGSFAAVGAPFEDENPSYGQSRPDAGSVYIFEKNLDGNWLQSQKITTSDRQAGDQFGQQLLLFGEFLLIGSPHSDLNVNGATARTDAGSVYLYKRDPSGQFVFHQKLVAPDRSAYDLFGSSLAMDAARIVVGATEEDEDFDGLSSLTGAGSVYIYLIQSSGLFAFEQKIVPIDRGANDRFGKSVGLRGNRILVSADQEDHDLFSLNTVSNAGSVYSFYKVGGQWVQVQKTIVQSRESGDRFGSALALNSEFAVISAVGEKQDNLGFNALSNAGAAYLFQFGPNAELTLIEKLVQQERSSGAQFGYSVALNEEWLFTGAPYDNKGGSDGWDAGWVEFYKLGSPSLYSPLAPNDSITEGADITINTIGEGEDGAVSNVSFEWIAYPNPTDGKLYIQTNRRAVDFEVYDLKGLKLIEFSSADMQTKINLNSLSKGAYLIKAKSEGKVSVKRILLY